MPKATPKLDALDWIGKRTERKPGALYRLPKLQGAVMDVMAVSELDKSAVSATAIISTPTPDRSEDVVRQLGISLANYKNNPVVYYDHGFAHIQTPIGKSEDEDGKITVKLKESGSQATCFFSQRMWEAMQIYELIDEGIVRCASIHIIPTKAKNRAQSDRFRSGLDIEESELLEWSWVGIPDNPEAVRKVLDRGKLADHGIPAALAKSLSQYAAQPKGLVQGMSIDAISKAAPPPFKKKGDEDSDKKLTAKAPPSDEPTSEQPDEETPVDSDDTEATAETPEATAETPPPNTQPAGDASQKPGAVLLRGVHQAISDFTSQLQSQIATQENNAVVSYITNTVAVLGGIAQECQEAYRAAYGMDMQSPQQQQMQPAGALPENEDDPFAKSLRLGTRPSEQSRLAVKGIVSRLKRIADDAAMPRDVRDQLSQSAGVLSRLAERAVEKSLPPDEEQEDVEVEDDGSAGLLKALEDQQAKFAELHTRLNALQLSKC